MEKYVGRLAQLDWYLSEALGYTLNMDYVESLGREVIESSCESARVAIREARRIFGAMIQQMARESV